MKWFKHDTDALRDAKIEKLIMRYGIEGYGLYFACVEIVAGNLSNEKVTFELEHDAEILGYKFKIDTLKVEDMMKYMCELGLFEVENTRIYCYKLATRIDSSLIKNKELLQVKKTIQEETRSIEKIQDNSSQSRVDKSRIEEKILYRECIYLTEKEYNRLIKDYDKETIHLYIGRLNDYLLSIGKPKKYDSHNYTIRSWIRKDVEKNKGKKKKYSGDDLEVVL